MKHTKIIYVIVASTMDANIAGLSRASDLYALYITQLLWKLNCMHNTYTGMKFSNVEHNKLRNKMKKR
jgi:hypothetical protein